MFDAEFSLEEVLLMNQGSLLHSKVLTSVGKSTQLDLLYKKCLNWDMRQCTREPGNRAWAADSQSAAEP